MVVNVPCTVFAAQNFHENTKGFIWKLSVVWTRPLKYFLKLCPRPQKFE
jgi:hypothetical protein